MPEEEKDVENDTDTEESGENTDKAPAGDDFSRDCIKLVPYPKIVFMYPTLVLALVVVLGPITWLFINLRELVQLP